MLSSVSGKIEYDIRTYRNHRNHSPKASEKVCAAMGAGIGTVLPVIFLAKSQKTSIFKIKYGIKEMMGVSASSIIGGLAGGLIGGQKEHRKKKVNESVFQFMNSTVPTLVTASFLTLTSKIKTLNKPFYKLTGSLVSLLAGMHIAAHLTNKITDPYDKVPDRKLSLKDSVANIDDALGALVLAKIPAAEKLNAEKLLPAIYSWCGYRSGVSS